MNNESKGTAKLRYNLKTTHLEMKPKIVERIPSTFFNLFAN